MYLTLKQLFKFGVVCVSACALNAVATTNYVSDSFEGGTIDDPIGEYKMVVSGEQFTNYAWIAESGDASVIAITNVAYADISDYGPITGGVSDLILKLETNSKTLSRAVTNVLDVETSDVYIDTLVQLIPSQAEPTVATADLKIALYVNAQSNLVVVSSMYTDPSLPDWQIIETNSVVNLAEPIDPEKWYRLSMRVTCDEGYTFTDIYIDGTLITHEHAFDIAGQTNGASSFLSMDSIAKDIEFISFQGKGALDELVVSDTMPNFVGTPAAITLTLAVVGDGTVTFTDDGDPLESPFEFVSGSTIVMTASDWHEIIDITSPGAEFSATPKDVPSQVIISELSATENCIVTVTNAIASGSNYPLGDGTYDLTKIANWAINNSLTPAQVTDNAAAYEDDYLLNVAPGTVATLEIKSIVVGATTTTIVVGTVNDNVAFDGEDVINGTLTVYTTDDLTTAFAEIDSVDLEITEAATTASVVITGATDQFLKARVE